MSEGYYICKCGSSDWRGNYYDDWHEGPHRWKQEIICNKCGTVIMSTQSDDWDQSPMSKGKNE